MTAPTTEVWVAWGDSEVRGADDPANLAAVLPGYPPATGLYMLRTGETWRALAEPCADGSWGGGGVGVGPSGIFGYLRGQAIGRNVAIINGGVGGTTTAQWLPGQSAYNSLLARAKAAVTRPGCYLGGYIVYIGANDAAAGTSAWATNASTIQAALEAQLGGGKPVIFAVLPPTVPSDTTYSTWATVRAQQQAWATAQRRAVDVPEGHWREAYNLHLDCEGNYLLAQGMLAVLGA